MINNLQIIDQKKGNATFTHRFDAHPAQPLGFTPKTSTWYALDGASGLVHRVTADGKSTSIRLKGWRGESRPVTAVIAIRP